MIQQDFFNALSNCGSGSIVVVGLIGCLSLCCRETLRPVHMSTFLLNLHKYFIEAFIAASRPDGSNFFEVWKSFENGYQSGKILKRRIAQRRLDSECGFFSKMMTYEPRLSNLSCRTMWHEVEVPLYCRSTQKTLLFLSELRWPWSSSSVMGLVCKQRMTFIRMLHGFSSSFSVLVWRRHSATYRPGICTTAFWVVSSESVWTQIFLEMIAVFTETFFKTTAYWVRLRTRVDGPLS